jgi:hypothetical protein
MQRIHNRQMFIKHTNTKRDGDASLAMLVAIMVAARVRGEVCMCVCGCVCVCVCVCTLNRLLPLALSNDAESITCPQNDNLTCSLGRPKGGAVITSPVSSSSSVGIPSSFRIANSRASWLQTLSAIAPCAARVKTLQFHEFKTICEILYWFWSSWKIPARIAT